MKGYTMKTALARGAAALLIPLVAVACQRQADVGTYRAQAEAEATDPVVLSSSESIPPGTTLHATLDQTLSTENSRVNDRFTATLQSPVLGPDRQTLVPAGTTLHGRITALRPSIDAATPAIIQLEFLEMSHGDRNVPFAANIQQTSAEVRGRRLRDALGGAAVGAASGAILGAVIRGDTRGAATGAAVGAAAGTAISLGMSEADAYLRSGTHMQLEVTDPVPLR
jgi:hypothetical protein